MVIINQWKTDIVLFLWSNKGVVQNKMINVTWTQTRMPSTSYFVGTIRYLPRPHLQWQPRGNFGFGALPKYTFDRRHSVIGWPDLPIDPQIPLMESLSCVKKKKEHRTVPTIKLPDFHWLIKAYVFFVFFITLVSNDFKWSTWVFLSLAQNTTKAFKVAPDAF